MVDIGSKYFLKITVHNQNDEKSDLRNYKKKNSIARRTERKAAVDLISRKIDLMLKLEKLDFSSRN